MKIELELDEGIYQAIKRMAPDVDIGILLSGLIRGVVITMATHSIEDIQAYNTASLEGSKEAREIDGQMLKLIPKVIEKARLGVYECDDCHQQFTIPQEDFDKVTCPSCGREWTREELAKLKIK